MPSGTFYGITTNPTLAKRAGWTYADAEFDIYFAHAKRLKAKELHIQVFGDPDGYMDFARRIYALGKSSGVEAVIKVPLVPDALPAAVKIKALGGKMLMTACYDAAQVLIAEALGAEYVAPYLGRMSDLGQDALAQAQKMQDSLAGKSCQLFAASIRSLDLLSDLAASGVPIATISTDLADQLISNEQSIKAAAQFDLDAKG